MSKILEPFGYFVNLKLLCFVFNDIEGEWFALTEFKEKVLEHKLIFKINKRLPPRKSGVLILLKDTPYGTISYLDFDSKSNMSHAEFMPNELIADMSNSFGFSGLS